LSDFEVVYVRIIFGLFIGLLIGIEELTVVASDDSQVRRLSGFFQRYYLTLFIPSLTYAEPVGARRGPAAHRRDLAFLPPASRGEVSIMSPGGFPPGLIKAYLIV
jgi:hypothetical protein